LRHQLVGRDSERCSDLQLAKNPLLQSVNRTLNSLDRVEPAGRQVEVTFVDRVALHDRRERFAEFKHLP
jgi:hypothetical protein